MNLRTITIGMPLDAPLKVEGFEMRLQKFLDTARTEFAKKNIFVRTFRINLTPIIESVDGRLDRQSVMGKIEAVSELCERLGIRWFNVPFDLTGSSGSNLDALADFALDILKRYPKTFINLIVASNGKIYPTAVSRASRFVKDVSRLDNSGYNNFRVGVSCNVRPNTPFFPFTLSSDSVGFSIGLELTQEFIKTARSIPGNDLQVLREKLLERISPQLKEIDQAAVQLSASHSLNFNGIDISLAPYPEEGNSVALLLELLGVEQQGSNGTLFLTAYLTDILKAMIKKSGVRPAGFNGVMFSLLEDDVMGKRNNNNTYSIDSLISYAAVCGCGLDMVPLPGDIFDEELASIILDVAALSTALDKPLGVRVLPIPMKHENEFTGFNMDFLFNTRIKKIKNLSFASFPRDAFFFVSNKQK